MPSFVDRPNFLNFVHVFEMHFPFTVTLRTSDILSANIVTVKGFVFVFFRLESQNTHKHTIKKRYI